MFETVNGGKAADVEVPEITETTGTLEVPEIVETGMDEDGGTAEITEEAPAAEKVKVLNHLDFAAECPGIAGIVELADRAAKLDATLAAKGYTAQSHVNRDATKYRNLLGALGIVVKEVRKILPELKDGAIGAVAGNSTEDREAKLMDDIRKSQEKLAKLQAAKAASPIEAAEETPLADATSDTE